MSCLEKVKTDKKLLKVFEVYKEKGKENFTKTYLRLENKKFGGLFPKNNVALFTPYFILNKGMSL